MSDAEVVPEPFELVGYSASPGRGAAQVARYDRAGRWKRAARGLGAWWGGAVVGAFIPVAHLLIIPVFGMAGVVTFAARLRTREVAREVRGTCPDCSLEQTFEGGRAWTLPHEVACAGCRRTLTARRPIAT